MDSKTKDEVWDLLKKAAVILLGEIEETNGFTFGKDEKEMSHIIGRIAGITYAELIKEVKAVTKEYIREINQRVDKF